MERSFGKYYSEKDFMDACWFNYIMGLFSGIAIVLLMELGFSWYKGWIW